MAKLALTVVLAFLFLAVSHARLPSDLPEHEVAVGARIATDDFPVSDPKSANPTLLLPSEDTVRSEPSKLVEISPEEIESELQPLVTDSNGDSVPLTVISFRPANRHFPRRPMIPFRHRHHCGHKKQFRPWDPRFQNREIPYGNDMILSDDKMGFDQVRRGGEREVPARWMRIHRDNHDGPMFMFRDDADFRGPHHRHEDQEDEEHEHPDHHHHHHHHHHHDDRHDREEEEEEEHEGGFLKRFRKFLTHF